jgi:hypothetical protein
MRTCMIINLLIITMNYNIHAQASTLIYTDQNNNSFIIENTLLQYSPVSRENSSSGIYSGGEPWTSQLSDFQAEELISKAKTLLNDTMHHSAKRIMTSSMIELKTHRKTEKAILLPSKDRDSFEEMLYSFTNKYSKE